MLTLRSHPININLIEKISRGTIHGMHVPERTSRDIVTTIHKSDDPLNCIPFHLLLDHAVHSFFQNRPGEIIHTGIHIVSVY